MYKDLIRQAQTLDCQTRSALAVAAGKSSRGETKTLAETAGSRFTSAAARLSAGDHLGWQLEFGADSRPAVLAFARAAVQTGPADFDWIFRDCASALPDNGAATADLFAGKRRVYLLERGGGSSAKDRPHADDYWDDDGYTDWEGFAGLYELLSGSRAVLRLLAGPAPDDGAVLMSLTGEISLRLHTVLGKCFPGCAVTELTPDLAAEGRQPEPLSADRIEAALSGLLAALMQQRRQESDAKEKAAASAGSTPLEELELSVRSYNCLKRAGVTSVEALRGLSYDELRRIRNLGYKGAEEIRERLADYDRYCRRAQAAPAPDDCAARLDELIGLSEVKAQVKKIAAFARMQQALAAAGKTGSPLVLNMEFTGNPGTAKTTVARIMAGLLHEIGLLESSELVEVGRADLVARYVGQTADQVKEVFQRAKGRLLFIDEAYSLVEKWDNSYGDEAINTIVQEMENRREDTVVIFAGYPRQMADFFARNPGLRSRVPFRISFSDYSAAEMEQIAALEADKRGFAIAPQAHPKLTAVFRAAASRPDSGNGRFCRNLVEGAILNYAARVYGDSVPAVLPELTLTAEDFDLPQPPAEKAPAAPGPALIGFRPAAGEGRDCR